MLDLWPGVFVGAQSSRVSLLPRSVSQPVFLNDLTVNGHDGIYDCCSATRAVKDESVSVMDSRSLHVCFVSPSEETDDNHILHVSTPPLEGARAAASGL